MFRISLALTFTVFTFQLIAQPFQPDEFGHVNSQKFKAFIAKKGYQLVGSYYEIEIGQNRMLAAKVLKENQWEFIDINGNEIKSKAEELGIDQNMPDLTLGHSKELPKALPGANDWISEKYQSIRTPEGKGFVYDGDTLAKPIYESIMIHPSQRILIVKKENYYGVINDQGSLIIPIEYEAVSLIEKGTSDLFYMVMKNGKTGVLSANNRITIPFKYERLTFMETYFRTEKKGIPCYGVISLDGEEILPNIYRGINSTYKGYFIVTAGTPRKKSIGLTDLSGKFILDTIYSDYHQYGLSGLLIQFDRDQLNPVKTTSEVFDIRTGIFVFPREEYGISKIAYRYGREVYDRTLNGWLLGWAGMSGKLLIEPQYDMLNASNDSPFLIAKKDNKYGVIDSIGNIVLPFNYEKLEHFDPFCFEAGIVRGDVFKITEGNKQGVINTKRKLVIPLEYESVITTANGIICKKGDLCNVMNLQGQVYLETSASNANRFNSPFGIEYGFFRTNTMIYDLYGNSQPVKP